MDRMGIPMRQTLSAREWIHYNDVIMGAVASQITSLMIVYSTVDSDADQRKHQSSASLAFLRGIPGEFPAKMASNAENVSIWWRHHVICESHTFRPLPDRRLLVWACPINQLCTALNLCVCSIIGIAFNLCVCGIEVKIKRHVLVLQLSLPNLLKPCVKLRMTM